MTTRGEISLRDIARKITFLQSLARFFCLKHLLSRTLDVVSVPESVYFWRNSDKHFPCFTLQQNDRNFTEMNKLLVFYIHSQGKLNESK